MGAAQPAPDRGGFRADLLVLIRNVAEQRRTAAWTSILPSIIDAAERDAEIATMQSSMHQSNMATFYAVIESANARGEVPPHASAPDLIAMLLGPLFYRRWFSKETIDDPFVDAVVEAATWAQAHGAAACGPAPIKAHRGPRKPPP